MCSTDRFEQEILIKILNNNTYIYIHWIHQLLTYFSCLLGNPYIKICIKAYILFPLLPQVGKFSRRTCNNNKNNWRKICSKQIFDSRKIKHNWNIKWCLPCNGKKIGHYWNIKWYMPFNGEKRGMAKWSKWPHSET